MTRTTGDDRRHVCPCCGHLAMPGEPGDYEVCPICDWEDDRTQLRWPTSDEGANGISLVEAQRRYADQGSGRQARRHAGRRPKADEPREDGWRPFDPAVDWTHPELDGKRWPRDRSRLYYWRSTYWNGDVGPLPPPPANPTGGQLLVQHLQHELPEVERIVEELEWQYGEAWPMQVTSVLADLVAEACRFGDAELGRRVVTALAPGLDETSPAYAWNTVAIGFGETEEWSDPAIRPYVEDWPGPAGEEVRRQLAHRDRAGTETGQLADAWADLWRTAPGQPVDVVEARLSAIMNSHPGNPWAELHVALGARTMSGPRWLLHHPWAGVRLAWRFRGVQSPLSTLRWLARPRFAG